jgi:triacylglycerol lipase
MNQAKNLLFLISILLPKLNYSFTYHPIVLAHGMSGFKSIGPVTYFKEIKEHLESLGYKIYLTQVDPFNPPEVRGRELALQLKNIYKKEKRKLNIIAHSQGGLDSRFAIAHYNLGKEIITLTTIGTPHHGTTIASVALLTMPEFARSLFDFFALIYGCYLGFCHDQDIKKEILSMSPEYMENIFNPNTPNDPNVFYYSYAGISGKWANEPVDPYLEVPTKILDIFEGPNDGMVSVESAKWGKFIGIVYADHLDEVGHYMFVKDERFDHLQFFEYIAKNLLKLKF